MAIAMVAATNKDGVTTGTINIFPSKPRRNTAHVMAQIDPPGGNVEKDGWARVTPLQDTEAY